MASLFLPHAVPSRILLRLEYFFLPTLLVNTLSFCLPTTTAPFKENTLIFLEELTALLQAQPSSTANSLPTHTSQWWESDPSPVSESLLQGFGSHWNSSMLIWTCRGVRPGLPAAVQGGPAWDGALAGGELRWELGLKPASSSPGLQLDVA